MKLRIISRLRNMKVMYADGGSSLLACGYQVFRRGVSGELRDLGALPFAAAGRLLAACRPIRQALRLGIHNLWRMSDGTILAIGKGAIFRQAADGGGFRLVERIRVGNKPTLNGLTVDADGRVYYGEYCLNRKREEPIGVYRSDDGGCTFALIHEFPTGQIRHIHFIQFDPYGKCLWLGTGDRDAECRLYCSGDAGASWELIGSGEQKWRTVGLAFTARHLYWGTDAGSDTGATPNYIMRWSRRKGDLEIVCDLQGPCHGTSVLSNGTLVVTTGVEGGANELDGRAHLWASRDGEDWQELASWEKDGWPRCVQYGVIHFPHGLEKSTLLHFTTLGLSEGCGESYHIARIETE